MRRLIIQTVVLTSCFVLTLPAVRAADNPTAVEVSSETRILKAVRHALLMLPEYWVFDDLNFQVAGGTVTLSGSVSRPTLRSSAERVVQRVEGVTRVVNRIEVLPLSPYDDRLRRAVYYAVYRNSGLDRYALQAVPPIHIIVRNGHVTLTGRVMNRMDKTLAEFYARGVSGVFSITNNLLVDQT